MKIPAVIAIWISLIIPFDCYSEQKKTKKPDCTNICCTAPKMDISELLQPAKTKKLICGCEPDKIWPVEQCKQFQDMVAQKKQAWGNNPPNYEYKKTYPIYPWRIRRFK